MLLIAPINLLVQGSGDKLFVQAWNRKVAGGQEVVDEKRLFNL